MLSILTLNRPEIALGSDNNQNPRLLDIAGGLRSLNLKYVKTHPTFSPVGLCFPQSITLLQTTFMFSANKRLPQVFRGNQLHREAIRYQRPETHRQFRPSLQQMQGRL